MKRTAIRCVVVLLPLTLAWGCVGGWQPEPRSDQSLDMLLTPVMMDAGLDAGMVFLPATLKTNILEFDKLLKQAKAVSLDESYRFLFGVGIRSPEVDPKSGDILSQHPTYGIFRYGALAKAQDAFTRLLVKQGIPEDKARQYVLVGNYKWAWSRDLILFAVSYRHPGVDAITVINKETGKVARLKPADPAWNEAFARDVEGQPVDEILDWAAVRYSSLRGDRVVATLFVIGAEAVKKGKKSPDYWPAEKRWLQGETDAVFQETTERVKRALFRR